MNIKPLGVKSYLSLISVKDIHWIWLYKQDQGTINDLVRYYTAKKKFWFLYTIVMGKFYFHSCTEQLIKKNQLEE